MRWVASVGAGLFFAARPNRVNTGRSVFNSDSAIGEAVNGRAEISSGLTGNTTRQVNFASWGIAVINMMSVTICGNNLIIPLFIFVNPITETGILIPLLIYFSARWRNTLPKQVGDYWFLNYLLPESGDKRGES